MSKLIHTITAITYKKGGAILRQLAAVLGPVFQKGLQNYIQEFQYKNAESSDLIGALQDTLTASGVIVNDWCNQPINLFNYFHLWLAQDNMPTLSINYTDGTYYLTQTAPEGHQLWPLPVFVQNEDGSKTTYWSARKSSFPNNISSHLFSANYDCHDDTFVPPILEIKGTALFFNRDELAVTHIQYSPSAIDTIIDGVTSFSNDLQLSQASILNFISHVMESAKKQGASQDRIEQIYENVLVHQRSAFKYGPFKDSADKINDVLQSRKFDRILDVLKPPY